MYLLMNDKEKIIVETVKELESMNLDGYEVYTLGKADMSELVNEGCVRDAITKFLKGNQMVKDELIEDVRIYLDISSSKKSRISKIITKMKKEGLVYDVEDWDYMGRRYVGMD